MGDEGQVRMPQGMFGCGEFLVSSTLCCLHSSAPCPYVSGLLPAAPDPAGLHLVHESSLCCPHVVVGPRHQE